MRRSEGRDREQIERRETSFPDTDPGEQYCSWLVQTRSSPVQPGPASMGRRSQCSMVDESVDGNTGRKAGGAGGTEEAGRSSLRDQFRSCPFSLISLAKYS